MSTHRSCPGCQESVEAHLNECPSCGEELRPASSRRSSSSETSGPTRRGLLAILLAGSYYYFAAGYGAWEFPFTVSAEVSESFALILTLSGIGLVLNEWLAKVAPSWAGQKT